MKINVIKDKSGKTIATFPHSLEGGLKVDPILAEGHKVEELDVPENYHTNLSAIYS